MKPKNVDDFWDLLSLLLQRTLSLLCFDVGLPTVVLTT